MARKTRKEARRVRHRRVRVKIRGNAERPRLCVFRSNKHFYAQLVDDEAGKSLCGLSSLSPSLKDKVAGKNGSEQARIIGQAVGELAKTRQITSVVFDRGGFTYGGRVKAFADAARAAGLEF